MKKLSTSKSFTLFSCVSETPTTAKQSRCTGPAGKIRQLLAKGLTFFNLLLIPCHKLLSYTLKLFVVSMVLYGMQDVLVFYALKADEATCKGWDCADLWCPPTYSIKAPSGEYVECEKLEQYLKENDL